MVSHTESKKARDTRNNLMNTWVKPFGLLELLVVDQGPEFTGEEFADFFREHGMLVHFTDGQSPWQNGPTERAGGAFKEMLDKVRFLSRIHKQLSQRAYLVFLERLPSVPLTF